MKRIYIIRHGETVENKKDIMIGNQHGELTKLGKEQTKILAKHLKILPLDIIYSSPLKRALDTAKTINKDINLKIITNELLKERDMGKLIGIKRKEFEILWNKQKDKVNFKPGNGESYLDILKRVKKFLRIIEKTKENNILVVTHGRFIKILINYINKKDLLSKVEQDNCCINIITYRNKKFKVETTNFVSDNETKHYCGGLITKDNKVLIGLRPANKKIRYPAMWSTFGGRLENNETIQDTLKREIKEELSIDVKEAKLFLQHPHLDFPNILRHIFLCKLKINDKSKFKYTEEIDSKWITKNTYKKLKLTPSTKFALDYYFKKA